MAKKQRAREETPPVTPLTVDAIVQAGKARLASKERPAPSAAPDAPPPFTEEESAAFLKSARQLVTTFGFATRLKSAAELAAAREVLRTFEDYELDRFAVKHRGETILSLAPLTTLLAELKKRPAELRAALETLLNERAEALPPPPPEPAPRERGGSHLFRRVLNGDGES